MPSMSSSACCSSFSAFSFSLFTVSSSAIHNKAILVIAETTIIILYCKCFYAQGQTINLVFTIFHSVANIIE